MDPTAFIIGEVHRLLASPDVTLVNLVTSISNVISSIMSQMPDYGLDKIYETINAELIHNGLPKYHVLPLFSGMPPSSPVQPTSGLVSPRKKLFVNQEDFLVIWDGQRVEIWDGYFLDEDEFGTPALDGEGNEITLNVYNVHPTLVATYDNVLSVNGREWKIDANPYHECSYYMYGSVLIELVDGRYVLVFDDVSEFTVETPLEEFFQLQARNMTTPYAIGEHHLYYFPYWLAFPRDVFTEGEIQNITDPGIPNVDKKYYTEIDANPSDYNGRPIERKVVYKKP